MKKQTMFSILLSLLLLFLIPSAAFAAESEINVTGTGIVMVNPDTANVFLTVETEGKTSDAAQKENNRIVQNVIDALLSLGIAKEDIVTTYTSVFPQYHYDEQSSQRSIIGYRSDTELQVTTNDINHAGKYIDAALQAGATATGGVEFSVSDQSLFYGQALQIAVQNAAKSAQAIANAYGRNLGEVKSITENSRNSYFAETVRATNLSMDSSGAKADNGTSIQYGKIQISANISVVYTF